MRTGIEKMWQVTEKPGALTGISVAGSFVFSFFYDWGYFFELGISFAQSPTTTADHFESWLVWLPSISVSLFIGLSIAFFTSGGKHGMPEKENKHAYEHPSTKYFLEDRSFIAIVFLSFLAIFLWILIGERFSLSGILVSASILWWFFGLRHFKRTAERARYSIVLMNLILIVPPMMFCGFAWGMKSAEQSSVIQHATHRIHSYDTESNRTIQFQEIRLVRFFGEWALIRNELGRNVWARLNQTQQLESLRKV